MFGLNKYGISVDKRGMSARGSILAESGTPWGKDVRVLVVDDEEFIRSIIRERLEIEGFSVDEAQNGNQALSRLGECSYSILLTDLRMPEMDGVALLREVSHRFPEMSRIVMTAHAELETAVAALKNGACDYILKPFSFDILFLTLRNALQKQLMERKLSDYKANLENKVKEQTGIINSMYVRSIQSLIKALEAKDHYTRGHSQRVTLYSMAIAARLDLPPDHLEDLRYAAILHDLGKIGVREAILNKPGALTSEEFREVVRHPEVATRILSPIPLFREILPSILHHHERFDGTGYPGRIAGAEIPLYSRIMAIADTYDAMTSSRAYRPALSEEEATAEIRRCAGTQFDPELVFVFLSVKDTLKGVVGLSPFEWQDGGGSDEDSRFVS
jgi:putative two-component system response regulator